MIDKQPWPEVQEEVDIESIIEQAQHCLYKYGKGEKPKDQENYMFETVMKAVFGKDFFKWYNQQNLPG